MPMFMPTLVGGLEVRERPARYHGQPRYKRIDFVRSHAEKEDYELVKTIYKTPVKKPEKKSEKKEKSEPAEPLMTAHQWNHYQQQQRAELEARQRAEFQARQRAEFEARQRAEFEARQRWVQEEQMRNQYRMNQQQAQNHHQHQHQQPPPPPMHHPQADPVGFAQPRQLSNQHGPSIHDIIGESDSSEDEDEMAYAVHTIKPSRKGSKSRPASVIHYQDDIYSSSEDEQPRSRHSRSRRRH